MKHFSLLTVIMLCYAIRAYGAEIQETPKPTKSYMTAIDYPNPLAPNTMRCKRTWKELENDDKNCCQRMTQRIQQWFWSQKALVDYKKP